MRISIMVEFEEVPSNLSEEDMNNLENVNDNYCFRNSLVDFHEDYGYCYSEKTIFAYSEKRRFL